jgi:hypothetical protein
MDGSEMTSTVELSTAMALSTKVHLSADVSVQNTGPPSQNLHLFGSHLIMKYNTKYEQALQILILCPWEAGKVLEGGS